MINQGILFFYCLLIGLILLSQGLDNLDDGSILMLSCLYLGRYSIVLLVELVVSEGQFFDGIGDCIYADDFFPRT